MTKISKNDAIDHAEATIEQSADYLELYIGNLKTITNDLATNPIIIDYFNDQATLSEDKTLEVIQQLITNNLTSASNIQSIIIISKDAKIISNEDSLNMQLSEDMMKEKWYLDAIYNKMPTLTSARMQSFNMDKDSWVISLSQEIVNENLENIGVVVIDIPYSNIEAYLTRIAKISNDSTSFILNSNDDLVYYPQTSMFENSEGIKNLISLKNQGNSYFEATNTLVTTYPIGNTDWTIVSTTKLTMLDTIKTQILKTILVGFGILFIGIILTGILLRKLANDIVKKEQKIRKYELNTLYAQINPHFLYNTLDTIVWLAEFNRQQAVIDTTKSLAKFFRLALNEGKPLTTVFKEVNHVRQYLNIQKQRYGEQLNYQINLEPQINDYLIPKLIIQPLVENSINHGLKELDSPGLIIINVFEKQDNIIIEIKDNGIGFNPLELEKKHAHIGLGLENVKERIKLIYNNQASFDIKSKINHGTTITIKLNKYLNQVK